jgi:putative ABC transport system permease protein
MLKSLFITAARNLIRNPFFSFINIFGLSAGLSAFLLLFLYVYNEITYDKFHGHHERIYRLLENEMEYTKGLTVPYLIENFPEIENGTRMINWTTHKLTYGEQKINQTITFADSGFFDVFTFKFLEGNSREALDKKYGIVLTRKLAEKFFGNEPALNRTIDVDQNEHQLVVTGVIDDIPYNSTR